MPTFFTPKSLQEPCAVCGKMVQEDDRVVWENVVDLRRGRLMHLVCSLKSVLEQPKRMP